MCLLKDMMHNKVTVTPYGLHFQDQLNLQHYRECTTVARCTSESIYSLPAVQKFLALCTSMHFTEDDTVVNLGRDLISRFRMIKGP